MANKYIPLSKSDLWKYRKEKAIKEHNRKQISEDSYIVLRRIHLKKKRESASFEDVAASFNVYVKDLKHKQIMEIFNYYVADID